MKQTARIISIYSADVMGVCSALFELGGMVVMHDASGCNSTYTTHDEPRWYDMDSMIYISGLSEMEAIMGDDEKLIGDIEEAASELHPEFIALAGSPISAMTGFDYEAVAQVIEQRTGIPSLGFPTTGMNTYIHGASMALAGIAERFVKEPGTGAAEGIAESAENASKDTEGNKKSGVGGKLRVNIIGLTPLDFSVNGTDASIVKWLEIEGFEVVSKWAMGSTLEELSHAAEADVNLVVSAAGFGAAKVLYEKFGIPYAVGLPVGNELPGLLADMIKIKLEEFTKAKESGSVPADFGSAEISVQSGIFLNGENGRDGSTYEEGFVAVIGEGVMSLSLAGAIEMECGIPAKVLCATECPEGILRECDRMTPDEDDIIPELSGAYAVVADPMYEPIVPEGVRFIPLPHEAFSGRIYRDSIPNIIEDFTFCSDSI
ncbi:MAG: oxidoreductase [Mogibacterium sp.]|nr:oxidoreductase [Mogibacterium sp.]